MSEERPRTARRIGRRGFLRTAGVAVGALATASAVPLLVVARRPEWGVATACLEQDVPVRIPSDFQGPAELELLLSDHGTLRILSAIAVAPGETVTVPLLYPYRSIVPGDYSYTARLREGGGRFRSSEPLVVRLAPYRFGC